MGIKIILADDHSVVRQGVSLILKSHFRDIEIKNASEFHEVISIIQSFNAQIIFLDINILGGNSTLMIEKIRKYNSKISILMFSAYEEDTYALRYIHAGANGFLSKEASEEEMVEAVNSLLKTGKYFSSRTKEKMLDRILQNTPMNPVELLSDREIEVAELLAKGLGNIEIANILKIQMSTVSTYKIRIFEKLKISNVVNLSEILRIHKS